MDVLAVFVVALVTALATGLGALRSPLRDAPIARGRELANSLAAGFMLGASLGLFHEGADYGVGRTALGVLAGGVFLSLAGRVIGRNRELHLGALEGADAGRRCSSSGS